MAPSMSLRRTISGAIDMDGAIVACAEERSRKHASRERRSRGRPRACDPGAGLPARPGAGTRTRPRAYGPGCALGPGRRPADPGAGLPAPTRVPGCRPDWGAGLLLASGLLGRDRYVYGGCAGRCGRKGPRGKLGAGFQHLFLQGAPFFHEMAGGCPVVR